MAYGLGFFDIFLSVLLSEAAMAVGALLFLLCAALLIFGRKKLSGPRKGLAAGLIATGIYLALIAWLVVMWG